MIICWITSLTSALGWQTIRYNPCRKSGTSSMVSHYVGRWQLFLFCHRTQRMNQPSRS